MVNLAITPDCRRMCSSSELLSRIVSIICFHTVFFRELFLKMKKGQFSYDYYPIDHSNVHIHTRKKKDDHFFLCR